jgi:RNA polymerase sigma factor (sigma-70 family)
MAIKSLNGVLKHLRVIAAVQTSRTASDRELLGRFVDTNDESAFTVLLERHAPLVLAVCRRALANQHDAEDACQATFLVLARKAASIRKTTSLGSWLHGVACRVAVTLKRDLGRRRRHEHGVPERAPPDPAAEVSWREVQGILDEELERVPERYRTPLVLCYLDGKTRDEAAHALGLSPGKLHGRLERGRELLRQRLAGRGLTLSGALLASALSASAAHAALPATFVVASAKAALSVAAGQPLAANHLVAANVLTLTQGVLKSMFFTKVKLATAGVLCAGLIAATLGGTLPSAGIAQDAKPALTRTPSGADKTESDEDFIRRISKDLRNSAPTPAEMHFFLASKDPGKRQKLIDLFITERQEAKERSVRTRAAVTLAEAIQQQLYSEQVLRTYRYRIATALASRGVTAMQKQFHKEVLAAKETAEVAKITQAYLDRLQEYVKNHSKNEDVPEAMRQIVIVYGSQGKTVEANAWREKLRKEYPESAAAKAAR